MDPLIPNNWDPFLNGLFHFLHLGVMALNLLGWIPKSTRKLNLVCLLLTAFFWLVVGAFWGIGYCPLTDWHWDVKTRLGEMSLPPSYIHWLFENGLGFFPERQIVDFLTGLIFGCALGISIWLNWRDLKRSRK